MILTRKKYSHHFRLTGTLPNRRAPVNCTGSPRLSWALHEANPRFWLHTLRTVLIA